MSETTDTPSPKMRSPAQAALVVGALGVVFGDIGTSPIYTIATVFNPSDPHPVAVSLPRERTVIMGSRIEV